MANYYLFKFWFIITIIFSFTACERQNSIDDSFFIDNSNSKIYKFKGFYFISETNQQYKLMYYDFLEDSVFSIFGNKTNNVISVEHNFLNNSVFFITIKRLNKKPEIPEYEGIKLFSYAPSSKHIELLNTFSPSIQIYSFWIDINRYKFVRVYFDDVVASYVNKNSLIYNPFGKLLSEENAVFDLVKSGYPVKETLNLVLQSNDKKYQIKIFSDSVSIFNKELNRSKKVLENKNILDITWADNQKHLIIFYEDKTNKAKNILLFDLINNKIVWTFDNKGIKNFLSIGNYLIFDYLENNSQKIEIFNIEKLLTVNKISFGRNNYLKNVSLR